jgi:hypothetical protein
MLLAAPLEREEMARPHLSRDRLSPVEVGAEVVFQRAAFMPEGKSQAAAGQEGAEPEQSAQTRRETDQRTPEVEAVGAAITAAHPHTELAATAVQVS